MSMTQFDLRMIIQKVKDTFKDNIFIGDAIDFLEAKESSNFKFPSIYILSDKELAQLDDNTILLKGKKRQFLYFKFNIIVVTKNNRYQLQPSDNDLENTLGKIRNCLIGWIPKMSTAKQCQLEGGQMLTYTSMAKIWQDNYFIGYAVGNDNTN